MWQHEGGRSQDDEKDPSDITDGTKVTGMERLKRLRNGMKNHGNCILICFDERTFTGDALVNKQSDIVVTLASMFMRFEKMPPVWLPTGSQLSAANYKDILDSKV